jgi:queuine/archaeosine tRNA-ribosyltransferase
MLISAYDLHNPALHDPVKMQLRVNRYSDSGGVLMVDSGGYESVWKNDRKWDANFYRTIISRTRSDFFFGFDAIPETKPGADESEAFEIALKDKVPSGETQGSAEFIPVLHGSNPKQLIAFVTHFRQKHSGLSNSVAIAERDCGRGICERVRTIATLRRILSQGGKSTIFHLLGCGSPSSLALYSYFGVDMFDSLDWTKFTLDEGEWVGRDFSYLDLLRCECSACKRPQKDYAERTLLHNLAFYQEFMLRIQGWIRNGYLSSVLEKRLGYLPEEMVK